MRCETLVHLGSSGKWLVSNPRQYKPEQLTVDSLSVLFLLAIEHGVLVSWKHLGFGRHVGLPSLKQLDCAHLPSLVGRHGDRAKLQATAQNLALLGASTMSAVVEWSVGLGVDQALALGGLGEFFCGGPRGANSLCNSCSRHCRNLPLQSTVKYRDYVVDAAKAAALAKLLRR
jgi:hypothetical protein